MSSPFAPRRSKKAAPPDDLGPVIDAILRGDAEVRRLTRKLKRAQRRLRKVCSTDAWTAYLIVEAETNARTDHVSHVLLRHGLDLAKRYLEPRP